MYGAIAGAATWLFIDLLGVPEIFGIGTDAGLIPFTLLGALLAITRYRFFAPVAAILLLTLTLIVSYTTVIVEPSRALIRRDSLPPSADAVVALSGGVTSDGYLTQQGADRTLKAVELVERGIAPVLLFTREERKTRGFSLSSAEDQARFAHLAHLSSILSTRKVKNTRDEAMAVSGVARYRGWKHIVLVTSPFHSRRACATFEKVGLTVSCIPSDSRDVAVNGLAHAHDRIVAFSLWLYETAGTLRYRQAGWI
jgi:uncharacterized SAM-binding protein YcdF (DUF218 family)